MEPRDVLLAVLSGLIDIPTPELRAVTARVSTDTVVLRFVYDRAPGELETELSSLCGTYTVAHLPEALIEEVLEHVPASQPVTVPEGELLAYRRYESDAWGD